MFLIPPSFTRARHYILLPVQRNDGEAVTCRSVAARMETIEDTSGMIPDAWADTPANIASPVAVSRP